MLSGVVQEEERTSESKTRRRRDKISSMGVKAETIQGSTRKEIKGLRRKGPKFIRRLSEKSNPYLSPPWGKLLESYFLNQRHDNLKRAKKLRMVVVRRLDNLRQEKERKSN